MKHWATLLLVPLVLTSLGCGLVRPYVPANSELLAKDRPYKLWKVPAGYIVVATFQLSDARNEVCFFETREQADRHWADRIAGRRVWTDGCLCGAEGRVHEGYTWRDPVADNRRCEEALAEAAGETSGG